ncbi:hypothetical protein A6R68_00885 [Neotoma lepida]|uniref:Uncharacterized protein n=1 Tax=Neotoma lepida TaxID=56216 RepID=A0A1A6GYZ5_NEOLE|nr:hypothetical protein A6R68_00885 [Neotoma lepida]
MECGHPPYGWVRKGLKTYPTQLQLQRASGCPSWRQNHTMMRPLSQPTGLGHGSHEVCRDKPGICSCTGVCIDSGDEKGSARGAQGQLPSHSTLHIPPMTPSFPKRNKKWRIGWMPNCTNSLTSLLSEQFHELISVVKSVLKEPE